MSAMAHQVSELRELPFDSWAPRPGDAERASLRAALENGAILYLPRLAFRVTPSETRFLTPEISNGASKNIGLPPGRDVPNGAKGSDADLRELGAMIARFATQARALVVALLPEYEKHLKSAATSFRPFEIEGRPSSWRKDDTRLHTDAFPSNPTHGTRILRVFSNVHPGGKARVWRVGERFEDVARRYLRDIPRPMPGSAWLLEKLHVTKRRRTEYDHYMLHLHDREKLDLDYQRNGPQRRIDFPPGSTWIVYSDQVMHAAMSGQHMLEQTFHLPPHALGDPAASPLKVLERLAGRALV